jgi:hypothetical protein
MRRKGELDRSATVESQKVTSKAVRRFNNTQVGYEPFAKFYTLLLFSAGYKSLDLIRSARNRFVLIAQPLQFHDSLDGPSG